MYMLIYEWLMLLYVCRAQVNAGTSAKDLCGLSIHEQLHELIGIAVRLLALVVKMHGAAIIASRVEEAVAVLEVYAEVALVVVAGCGVMMTTEDGELRSSTIYKRASYSI